jgi:hypothetical protein
LFGCQPTFNVHDISRFREIPPFGRDGIRKILSNRSELKKMTAHDFEDMIQASTDLPIGLTSSECLNCQIAIPVFEGLLPEPHNTHVLKLLFDLAHWHGLAKLRMQTDPTLDIFSQATTSLGDSVRGFEEKTCALFKTRELERERAARQRRQNAATESRVEPTPAAPGNSKQQPKPAAAAPGNSTRKSKLLNLKTYKYHALGDYVTAIRQFGTTDSYSTQPVSPQFTPLLSTFRC